jgi:hypothetical protein
MEGLSPEISELIKRTTLNNNNNFWPTDADLASISSFIAYPRKSFTELTVIYIKLIHSFVHSLEGFSHINEADKDLLKKACAPELFLLRLARLFRSDSNSIVIGNTFNSFVLDSQSFEVAGLDEIGDKLITFAQHLSAMELDESEFALLSALCVFTPRGSILNPSVVNDIQEVYASALQNYLKVMRSNGKSAFNELLLKLGDLAAIVAYKSTPQIYDPFDYH